MDATDQLRAERDQSSPTLPSPLPTRDRSALWLIAAMAVALLLRSPCLISPFFWLDEYVTLWSIGGSSYGEMLDRALHWTASGPLFVLCYRLSWDLTGSVDVGLKLPGVIFGTLTVWATWWTTRRLFNRSDVAIVAAWFVALAPQFIHFSQEARPYTIATLLVMLATGFLATWVREGRWCQLAAVILLTLAAVGFHLLAALILVAHNTYVLLQGLLARWPWQRWGGWIIAQILVACGLWIVGAQFRMLSGRHDSMILDTSLPMLTRQSLDEGLWGEARVEFGFALIGLGLWWCARRFPQTGFGKAWAAHAPTVCLAGCSYLVPTALLSTLSAMRVVDCWARYYFLFHSGFMIVLAWMLVCPFPRRLSRWLMAAIVLGMMSEFSLEAGLPTCQLNGMWKDLDQAQAVLRQRVRSDDLVISRSGLIESNHARFLSNAVGESYLKAFCETRGGPLAAEHVPLPFSPESDETRSYLESLVSEKLLERADFWLVNVGPMDFNYDEWFRDRLSKRFQKIEELNYRIVSIYHYARRLELDSE